MGTMLQEPGFQQRTESPPPAGPGSLPTTASSLSPLGTILLAKLQSAGEKALGLLLGIVMLVVQVAGYVALVLVLPFAPFLLPLLLLPVILAFALVILGVGALLGALGWL